MEERINRLANRFAGFSLEKREQWFAKDPGLKWRCCLLPNKQERQAFQVEAYAETAEDALRSVEEHVEEIDCREMSDVSAT